MKKKLYNAPVCEIIQWGPYPIMKDLQEASLPNHVGAPARHLGGTKSEVF